MLIFPDAP